MTLLEASNTAKQFSYTLAPPTEQQPFYAIMSGKQEQGMLYFCGGKLKMGSYTVSSDFQRFIRLLQDLEKRGTRTKMYYGNMIAYDGQEHAELDAEFVSPGGEYLTKAQLYSSEKYGVTNYQITYSAADYSASQCK